MDDAKRCSKYDNDKGLSEYNFGKDTQKYRNQGENCIEWINKEYRTMNKDEIKIRRKQYFENIKNKNLKRIYDIDSRERNRDKIQFYKKNYFQNNKEELYKKT